MKRQRAKCKNGKLPKAQRLLLQKLGVDLEPGKSREESWQCKVQALKNFIAREGGTDGAKEITMINQGGVLGWTDSHLGSSLSVQMYADVCNT